MNKICPYDEITPMSLTGCHECGFRLICIEYEKALRYMFSYIRMGNSARICGKRIMIEDLRDIYRNKLEMISDSFWRWTSNEELLKDIAVHEVRYL